MHKATIVITGSAGFIGFHTAQKFLAAKSYRVIGIDNLSPYYDVGLKKARLAILDQHADFIDIRLDLEDGPGVGEVFARYRPQIVVNLAAQAGVRYSFDHPHSYVKANITGFLNLLEACRHYPVEHLVFASTSSVYGANGKIPFSVHEGADHPLSFYAATKKANEAMAHSYSHLFQIPVTGLRFFTVYGPWGRPDMALFLFTKSILQGEPIQIFNHGQMQRDFTYIEDIVNPIFLLANKPPSLAVSGEEAGTGRVSSRPLDPASSPVAPYRLLNLGNRKPVPLLDFVTILEKTLGMTAKKEMKNMQPGDVPLTCADIQDMVDLTGYTPCISVEEGIKDFVAWYRSYYQM